MSFRWHLSIMVTIPPLASEQPSDDERKVQAIMTYLRGEKRRDLVRKALGRLLKAGWLRLEELT